jgi:ElaB/YqjD/DUF883 family membrane-anchored ribosome-binding protein
VSAGVDKVKEAVQSGAEKTKEVASAGIDKAKDLAQAGYEKAKDLASSAGKMADNATSSVGSGIESLGHTIREKAPHEGMLGSAASTVAGTLEQGGRYLREEGLSGMADDLTNTIRRHPIQSILVAVAVGFLLSRATRS